MERKYSTQMTMSSHSTVWKYFDKINGGKNVKCKLCGRMISYHSSTTVMKNHLNSFHSTEVEESENAALANSRGNRSQPTDKKDPNEDLVFAICTSSVPYRFLKNKHFLDFCHKLNSDHKILTPDSLRSKFSKNRSEYVDRLKKELKHVEKAWLSFDGWEAKYMDKSIYAIFIYYVENFQRKSALLGIECVEGSATAANVGKLVMRMLDLYCIDKSKVLGAVTDAGSNIVAFLDRNELFHSHCSAHVLSLIIKKSAQITHIKELIAKVNRCAAFLSRSKVERGKFRERSSMLNIHGRPPLPFSDTRWGGALLLAEAFLNHYQSLSATPALQDYLMNADDLAALKKYVNQRSALGRCLSNETKSRYDSYVENDALLMSTYLDARFAYLPGILQRTRWEFIENSIQLYCDSIHVLNQTATGPPPKKPTLEESSFSQFVQSKRVSSHGSSVQAEMSNYKAIVLSGRPALDSSPLLFWHAHRDRFPILQKMGQHFLACTQSSAIVERLFSVCGCIVNNSRRNRMKSSTLNLHLLNASLATLQAKNEAGEMNEYDECEQSDSESEENRHEEISGEFNDDIFEEALARAMTI
ncbi:unnamed protein product [Caenorhabditis nigoni]